MSIKIPQTPTPASVKEILALLEALSPEELSNIEWEVIQDPDRITNILLERNKHHFGQAQGTPFTVEPLKSQIGPHATSSDSDDILDGIFEPGHLVEAARAIIHQLRQGKLLMAPIEITLGMLISAFKKWRTATTTSPSNLYLDLYKMFCTSKPKEAPKQDANNPQPWIVDVFFGALATKLQASINYGIVYDRWKTIVNYMLEKIDGNPRIDKLHVIQIIEADFNLLMGLVFGRLLTRHATTH